MGCFLFDNYDFATLLAPWNIAVTKHLQKYCTVDELAEAFVPTKVPQTIDPITKS